MADLGDFCVILSSNLCENLDLRHGFVVNLMPLPIVLAVLSAKFEVNVCRSEFKICYRKIKIELFNAIWALLKTQSKLKFDLNKDDKRLTPELEPSFCKRGRATKRREL